ncbi:MAG: hypothetical protein WHT29_12690, partial [Bacteroidales bacterium]
AEVLKNTKHKWLLTYDNSEYIKNLYSFAYIKEWNLTYGMRNVGENANMKGNELFISNYLVSNDISANSLFDEIEEIQPITAAIRH